MNNTLDLVNTSAPFLTYLERWYGALAPLPLSELVSADPERVGLISIDVINGFCTVGALASARVGRIAAPVAQLFERAYTLGVRCLALTQDTHDPAAPEFAAFPPHCLRGTTESEAVDELKALPFYAQLAIFPKNSINSHVGTSLGAWVADHPYVDRWIVVGDCSDLCVYQAAMQLRLEANAANLARRVIVAADVVDTFDMPVATAHDLGIKAHDGDLHHVMFLHHMALSGVEVVRKLS